jgi:hypothetical protein
MVRADEADSGVAISVDGVSVAAGVSGCGRTHTAPRGLALRKPRKKVHLRADCPVPSSALCT